MKTKLILIVLLSVVYFINVPAKGFFKETGSEPEKQLSPDEDFVVMQIGNNMYKTFNYNGNVWMVENSKEGNPTETTYPNRKTGENGYYYTQADAATACPKGWHLPTVDEYLDLKKSLSAITTEGEASRWWVKEEHGAFAGYNWRTLNGRKWAEWGTHGYWWTSSSHEYFHTYITRFSITDMLSGLRAVMADGTHWLSVRCVKGTSTKTTPKTSRPVKKKAN